MSSPDLVIMGLGNPGQEYARTRHNVGFWFIEQLSGKMEVELESVDRSVLAVGGTIAGYHVVLSRPRTYVNLSGTAAKYLVGKHMICPSRLLVVYDDLNLPVGKMRLRGKGSAGGHNGMRSIITALNTELFPRLRIGIGRPSNPEDQINYVLGEPAKNDRDSIKDNISKGVSLVEHLLAFGMDSAMDTFN